MFRLLCLLALLPLAAQADEPLTAEDIVSRAHAAAGGDFWVKPRSAFMSGHALFWYGGAATPVPHEQHRMWRVYPTAKSDAHQADGKVRIDSIRDGKPIIQLAFDGTHTYNQQGKVPEEQADSRRWASNFGFGVIRHALDEGYSLRRVADDEVDGHPVHVVQVIDPAGGETLFAFDRESFAIRKLAFATPRGWHERLYSDFFSKPGVDWVQPGKVRLYYNGVKSNEVYWTDFRINEEIPGSVFVLGGQ